MRASICLNSIMAGNGEEGLEASAVCDLLEKAMMENALTEGYRAELPH